MSQDTIFKTLSSISRKMTILRTGKLGVLLNNIFGDMENSPIKTFCANNGLIYKSDLRSYTENYVPWTGEYEGATMDKILPIVPKSQNVLDIGGNVGYWTVNLANQIDKNQKVYTFEPIKTNFERIEQITKLNDFENKTKIFNIGLGDKSLKADFDQDKGDVKRGASTFNASLIPAENGVCKIEVFDEVVKKEKISNIGFIKIDIEGFEIKFLHGAKEFFEQNRPVIYGEFGPEFIVLKGDNPLEVYEFFHDYTFFKEERDHSFKLLAKDTKFDRDILIIPNEKLIEIQSKFNYIK
jgi:FkbM family methyltransferase